MAYDWASPLVCISRVPATALSPPSANIPRPVSPLTTNCRAENNAAAQSDLNETNWMQQWLWHAVDCVTMDIIQWRLANTSDLTLFSKFFFHRWHDTRNFINQPIAVRWPVTVIFILGRFMRFLGIKYIFSCITTIELLIILVLWGLS